MAKFCGNCGAQSEDNAKMCGNCGAPFAESQNGVGNILSKIPGVNDINIKPEQKDLIMKIAKIAVPVIAAVAVVLIVVFAAIVPNTGAQGAMKKYFKALSNADSATIIELLPARYSSDAITDEDYLAEAIGYFFEYTQENIEKKFGDYKYKVKDVNAKKLDKDDLEDYEEAYDELVDDYEDFESPKITAGYKIKCELVLKGEKKDKDAKCTVYMIKEDGKWVVWSVSSDVPGAEVSW